MSDTCEACTTHDCDLLIGDVRSGSVKRVSAAAGEGAMAVQFIHRYLARQAELAAAERS